MKIKSLFLLIATLLWSGCSSIDGDEPMAPDTTETNEPGTYLRLTLTMPSQSRANPLGGEYGDPDGPIFGSDNENMIENLTVFFYQHADGPNAPDDTPIDHAVYIHDGFTTEANGSVWKVIKLVNFLPVPTHRVLVAANCGDLTSLQTIGQVRNHELTQRWRGAEILPNSKGFTMASALTNDGHLEFASRIDGTPLDGTKENPFGAEVWIERTAARIDLADVAEHGSYDAGSDRVNISNILVVNDTRAASWLIKRVTRSTSDFSSVEYCGDELIDAAERPLNYVLEPRTLLKSTSTSASDLTDWYGATTAANVEANYATLFNASNSFAAIEKNYNKRNYTLAYTNENTQPQELHLKEFATGIAIKATYVPKDFTAGQTFWRYTSGDGKNLAKYFSSEAEAEAYKDDHEEEHGTVTGFPNGICYYHAWIRHANVTDAASGNHICCPMEYAIVRNNVYELKFHFNGPGTPTPRFDQPESVVLHVYVRPWNLRKQSTILM